MGLLLLLLLFLRMCYYAQLVCSSCYYLLKCLDSELLWMTLCTFISQSTTSLWTSTGATLDSSGSWNPSPSLRAKESFSSSASKTSPTGKRYSAHLGHAMCDGIWLLSLTNHDGIFAVICDIFMTYLTYLITVSYKSWLYHCFYMWHIYDISYANL